MRKQTKIIIVVSIVLLFILWNFFIPFFVTKFRVEKASREALVDDLPNGYCFEDKLDWWDNPICVERKKFEEGIISGITYKAIAPGKDGVIETKDDYSFKSVDLNKSKIIGKYTKDKVTQFMKGWKEKTNSKHNK